MDLRQLNALLAVADTGSFSAAARSLHTVQSNVSTHVARLERELDTVLVDRTSGALTEEGQAVATRARHIQREIDALVADVASLHDEVAGSARIGVIGTTARWLVPPLVVALQERHPKVRLVVVDATTTSLVPQLAGGALDLAVVHLPLDEPDLVADPLFDEDPMLVAPLGHPLADRARVTLADIAEHPVLLEPEGTGWRDMLDAQARALGLTLQPQAEIDGMRLLASLAFQGFGAAILPASAAPGWVGGDWKRVPIDGLEGRTVGVAWRRRGLLSALARAVREVIRDVVDDKASGQPGIHPAGTQPAGQAPGAGAGSPGRAGARPAGEARPPLVSERVATGGDPRVTPGGRGGSERAMPPPGRTVVPLRARVSGAVSARVTEIGGRPAVVVEIDPAHKRGALTRSDGDTLAEAATVALQERLPLVAFVASSGADVAEGVSALVGWGGAARQLVRCSGVVPVVLVVTGPAVSGPALLLGLADVVIMTPDAYAFVSGPRMVTAFTGVPISTSALGGPGAHSRASGVASLIATDLDDARDLIAVLLAHLPGHADEEPPHLGTDDPADRPTPEAGALIPATVTGSYDVRAVARAIVDDGELLELRPGWAANLVTALATIAGRPVGIVANQPQTLAGTLDIAASQKGARFVAFCDAFNVPLLTLIDTPGFSPGKDLEWRGMIRHGAQLAFAYARATVPRISLTLRKSYGGAFIVMDSKTMGNDLALAWPSAEIAVMGAKGAVEILHRRAAPEERAGLEADYEERLLNPYLAAERGYLDAVIDPADSRREIDAALEALSSKRERLVGRAHDNTPL